jgi:polyvinyl alcohol dehydrogenase (cytochrome)
MSRTTAPVARAASLFFCVAAACPAFTAVAAGCPNPSGPVAVGTAQWNGWGRDIDNSRYQPEPAIRAADVSRLRFKWAYGYAVRAPANETPEAAATAAATTAAAAAPAGAAAAVAAAAAPADAEPTVDAQPTVVDGRLFAISASGRVSAIDAATACTYWTFDAAAGTRAAAVVGELKAPKKIVGPKKKFKQKKKDAHIDVDKPPSAVFFGDDSGAVYALDAQSGRLLWKTQVDAHPLARIAGSPTLYKDRLYVPVSSSEERAAGNPSYPCCTFRGSVAALDIVTGQIVWRTFMTAEQPKPYKTNDAGTQLFAPAGMAVRSAPAIDADHELLFVAAGKSHGDPQPAAANAIVALNLEDGKIAWIKQLPQTDPAADFDGAVVLRNLSLTRKILVTAQRSTDVYGLDPGRAGEILWRSKPQIAGATAIQWGPAADHRSVYLAFASPGVSAAPADGLVALDIATGRLRWAAPSPPPPCSSQANDCAHTQSRAVTVIPGIAFLGSMDGHLRGFSTIDGKILWDFDTARSFETANGVPANGGRLDRGGPVIVAGMMFVNSGNALLAFSLDGK